MTKMDIQYFDGHLGIEELLDWMNLVEIFIENINVPKENRVKLVAYRFKTGAATWGEQIYCNQMR